jgi:hypothetical protein
MLAGLQIARSDQHFARRHCGRRDRRGYFRRATADQSARKERCTTGRESGNTQDEKSRSIHDDTQLLLSQSEHGTL